MRVEPELIATLEELLALLRDHGELHWSEWIANDLNRIRDGDAFGLDHLLQAFGGMGSLNDFAFSHEEGIAPADVDRANVRLGVLVPRTYEQGRLAQRTRGAG